MEIHDRVRKTRSKLGISQQNMADALDLTQPAYHKLENGKTKLSVDHIKLIAKEFGMQVQELISDHEAVLFQDVHANHQVNGINISGLIDSQEREALQQQIDFLTKELDYQRSQNAKLIEMLQKAED